MTDRPNRWLAGVPRLIAATDGDAELLERFATRRDEVAFAALVARHGPLVLRTCRRLLGDAHAADDAFQATFLVLARKARAVGGTVVLAAWLHAVAHRVVANARRTARRRPRPDVLATEPPSPNSDPAVEVVGRETLAAVEREVARLPEAYRLPVLLCCLEGFTQEEAARQLGCTPGAVRGRLERARARLAAGLRRHGIALPAMLAGVELGRGTSAVGSTVCAGVARNAALFSTGRPVPTSAIPATVVALANGGMNVPGWKRLLIPCAVVLAAGAVVPAMGLADPPPPPVMPVPDVTIPNAAEIAAPAPQPDDGIYAVRPTGNGIRLKQPDGTELVLVKRLSSAFGKPELRSTSNDNTQFALVLCGAGPLTTAADNGLAVVVSGVAARVHSYSLPTADGVQDLHCTVEGDDAARAVAAGLKVTPTRRSHPGHQLVTRFFPEKNSYPVGEPIVLKMEIRNAGPKSVAFQVGGQQRGPRDNQYRFIAFRGYGGGRAVPDTGDPRNMGGLGSVRTLKPGETFTASVPLDRWFRFTEPDGYRVTGLYLLALHVPYQDPPEPETADLTKDPRAASVPSPVIWEDFAVGECTVVVVSRGKP